MPTTPILGITQVSTSQAGKETTINDAIVALEAAGNAKLDVNMSAGNVTLSATQATRNYIFRAVSATAARELRFPIAVNSNPLNRLFAVRNESGHALTVRFASGAGSTVIVPNGQARLISAADGLNMTVAAEPATVVSFTSLTDVPASYTGQAGKVLAVNVAENALEFINAAVFPSLTGNAGKYLVVNGTATGVQWADASTVTSFLGLTDSPSNYTGQGGKIVAVKNSEDGVEFVDPPEAEAVQFVSAARWRIFVVTPGLEDQTGFGEVELLNLDNIDLTGTGTATASNEAIGFEAEKAFDNITTPGTGWLTEDTYTGDVWLEYEFTAPVSVRRVRLTPVGAFENSAPLRFLIQYYDGSTWVSLGDRTANTWEDTVPQTFKVNGVNLESVAEAPLDGNPYVRKDGGWEVMPEISSVPDGGTTGQVLTKLSATDGDADWVDPTGGEGGPLAVATQATAATNLDPAQANTYVRYTAATAKTVTVRPESIAALPADGEWTLYNQGAGDLTIVAGAGVTIRAPAGGSLVVPTLATVTLKRVAADSFDLIGQTVGTGSGVYPSFVGQANRLLRVNPTEDDVEWVDSPVALPPGGLTGQVLAKSSDGDGDAEWVDADFSDPEVAAAAGWQLLSTSGVPITSGRTYDCGVNPAISFMVQNLAPYDHIMVVMVGVGLAASGFRWLRVSHDNGATFSDAGYALTNNNVLAGTVDFNNSATTQQRWNHVELVNIRGAQYFPRVIYGDARGNVLYQQNQADINAIMIASSGGNLNSGYFMVYGRTGNVSSTTTPLGGTNRFSGALVKKTVAQAIGGGTQDILTFNDEEYDTDNWHSNTSNNSRLTVPVGVSRVRVSGRVSRSDLTGQLFVGILKNGVNTAIGLPLADTDTSGLDNITLSSAVMDVVPGDYFELFALGDSPSSIATTSWFSIEAVSGSIFNPLTVPFQGCRATRTTDVSANGVFPIPFTVENYDNGNWHDNVTNNSRFVVPAGVTRIEINGQVEFSGTGNRSVWIRRNGLSSPQQATGQVGNSGFSFSVFNISTGVIECVPGDYFELIAETDSLQTVRCTASRTWLAIKAVTDRVVGVDLSAAVNTQVGTSYTLAVTDTNDIVEMTNAVANIVTIPSNASASIPPGAIFSIVQIGTGPTTIQAAAGVTLNGISEGEATLSGQWAGVSLYKRAANAWVIQGAHGGVT